jgi:hypothetical protein
MQLGVQRHAHMVERIVENKETRCHMDILCDLEVHLACEHHLGMNS